MQRCHILHFFNSNLKPVKTHLHILAQPTRWENGASYWIFKQSIKCCSYRNLCGWSQLYLSLNSKFVVFLFHCMFNLFASTFEDQQYTVHRQDLHMGSPTIYETLVKRDLDELVLAVGRTLNSCSWRNLKNRLCSLQHVDEHLQKSKRKMQFCLQFRKWSPPLSWMNRLHCLLHKRRLKQVGFILGRTVSSTTHQPATADSAPDPVQWTKGVTTASKDSKPALISAPALCIQTITHHLPLVCVGERRHLHLGHFVWWLSLTHCSVFEADPDAALTMCCCCWVMWIKNFISLFCLKLRWFYWFNPT